MYLEFVSYDGLPDSTANCGDQTSTGQEYQDLKQIQSIQNIKPKEHFEYLWPFERGKLWSWELNSSLFKMQFFFNVHLTQNLKRNQKVKQLDVEVSTPAKDFRYDLQLAKTGS